MGEGRDEDGEMLQMMLEEAHTAMSTPPPLLLLHTPTALRLVPRRLSLAPM